jgi:hypothetical protein
VDHDVSLLIPELWCRMGPDERTAAALVAEGALERCRDSTHAGRPVLASRLGWRITDRFATKYLGRIFNHPHLVFTPEMLRPELQDAAVFADGMDNIVTTHRRVAEGYFRDGGLALACPPLRALLHVMHDGAWEGRGLDDPAFRALFTRDALLACDWYRERLHAQQRHDVELLRGQAGRMEGVLKKAPAVAARLGLPARYEAVRQRLHEASQPAYVERLRGTLGRQAKFA